MMKKYFDTKSLEKFAKNFPLSPNQITLISVLCAASALLFSNYMSFALFALAIGLDALDGIVARARKKASKMGAFLDGICDRIVEFFIIVWLLLHFPGSWPVLVTLLFFGSCMISFSKAYAYYRKVLSEKQVAKLVTFIGREERTALLMLSLLLIQLNMANYANMIIYATAFLSVISFLYLIMQILKSKA